MKTNCTISISRPQGRQESTINICIQDEISRTVFFDGQMELSDFAKAITGLSSCPIDAEFRGLENIGKAKIVEPREVVCPLKTHDRKDYEKWLKENAQEEGWILSTYLGSQASVGRNEKGETLLRYSVTKYVQQ